MTQKKTAREYLANYLADLHYHQNEGHGHCSVLETVNAFTCGTPEFSNTEQFNAYVEDVEAALASITGPDDEAYYNYYEDQITKAPTLPSVMDLLHRLASEMGVDIIEAAGGRGHWILPAHRLQAINTFTALRDAGYCRTAEDLQEQLLYLRSLMSG